MSFSINLLSKPRQLLMPTEMIVFGGHQVPSVDQQDTWRGTGPYRRPQSMQGRVPPYLLHFVAEMLPLSAIYSATMTKNLLHSSIAPESQFAPLIASFICLSVRATLWSPHTFVERSGCRFSTSRQHSDANASLSCSTNPGHERTALPRLMWEMPYSWASKTYFFDKCPT